MPLKLFSANLEDGLALAERVDPKYAPAWQNKSAEAQAAMAMYFLPHSSQKHTLGPTRPRVVKWYCPFADQAVFPSGHRYCINVYTGCSHGCVYCYAAGYLAMNAKPKANYRRLLRMDLDDLEAFDVPPAPVHLSNSTDAFQENLEKRQCHSLYTLQQLANHRKRFTTITLLTKNPALLCEDTYLNALLDLHRTNAPVVVEVSLAFWRQKIANAYDPGAPTIASRLAAIQKLCQAGLHVVLRISPTYPIHIDPPNASCPQTADDMDCTAQFAAETGVEKIVHTPAKIVRPKSGRLHPLMESMLALYRRLAGSTPLDFKGGSWRLPHPIAQRYVVDPLADVSKHHGVYLQFCMSHLLSIQ